MSNRTINFEGRRISVPADATDDEVSQILSASSPAPAAPANPGALLDARRAREVGAVAQPAQAPPTESRVGRNLMLGAQGVGRGIADLVGMVPDLSTGAVNLGLAGADAAANLFGGSVDYRFSPSPIGSDAISSTVGSMAEAAGVPLATPQTPTEKLAYNVNRFGTQALATGVGLMRAGSAMTPSNAPRMSDPFIKPYVDAPLKTVAGDAVAGAGAGTGLTISQEYLPQNVRDMGGGSVGTIADYLAMMAGGFTGGIGAATVADAPTSARSFLMAKRPAQGVDFDPATGEAVTNRAMGKAAEKMQGKATDPAGAIQSIDQTINDFGSLPLPTTGLMSGDSGLINLEQGFRTKQGGSSLAEGAGTDPGVKSRYNFIERDTALRDAAVDEVNRLRPQDADPNAFPARAGEIVDMRLAAAQRPVDKAAGETRAVETAQKPIADEFNTNLGQAPAASRNIDEVYRTTREAERDRSNALYTNPAIAEAQVPVQPLADTAQQVARQGSAVAPLDPVVQKYTDRFKDMGGQTKPPPRTADDYFQEFRARAERDWRAEGGDGPLPGWLVDEARADARRAASEALGARQVAPRVDATQNIADPFWGAPDSARRTANGNLSEQRLREIETQLPPKEAIDAYAANAIRFNDESGPFDREAILRALPKELHAEAEAAMRAPGIAAPPGALDPTLQNLFEKAYPGVKEIRAGASVPPSYAAGRGVASKLQIGDGAEPVLRAANDRAPPAPPAATASMADVNNLRASLEADIKANLGNGAIVSQLRQFKDQTAAYAERLAAEGSPAGEAAKAAAENFATRVQPNFREGAGGRVDATLKGNPNSPSVAPSEMAGNFLTRPEDAQALMRIAELGGNRETVANSARTWLFDQLASSGIAKGGAINGERLARWRNKNSELVDAVPGLRQEVDGLVRDANRGVALKADYAAQLSQAERNLGNVKKQTEGGILGAVRDKSPDKAVATVFSSDNPEKALSDLVATVGRNPKAREGLQAAMAEHIATKVSGVAPQNVSEGSQNINFAQLTKFFDQNRKVLAKLYSPEEMNSLQSAQKVLAPLAKRAQQAGVGSKTDESVFKAFWNTFEGGAKLYFGMLKGGGITRTARLLAEQLDDGSTAAAERLLARAMFDPKLAKQLLSAKVEKPPAPAYSKETGKLLRRGEAARQISEEEDEQ